MSVTIPSSLVEICDLLGRRKIAEAVGVRSSAVSNALGEGTFPAHWFEVIESLCEPAGVVCDRRFFRFVRPCDAGAGIAKPSEDAA